MINYRSHLCAEPAGVCSIIAFHTKSSPVWSSCADPGPLKMEVFDERELSRCKDCWARHLEPPGGIANIFHLGIDFGGIANILHWFCIEPLVNLPTHTWANHIFVNGPQLQKDQPNPIIFDFKKEVVNVLFTLKTIF